MPRTPRKLSEVASQNRRKKAAELDPLVADEIERALQADEGAFLTMELPLLPIRDQVYFPHMIFPLLVGREKSVRALEASELK